MEGERDVYLEGEAGEREEEREKGQRKRKVSFCCIRRECVIEMGEEEEDDKEKGKQEEDRGEIVKRKKGKRRS